MGPVSWLTRPPLLSESAAQFWCFESVYAAPPHLMRIGCWVYAAAGKEARNKNKKDPIIVRIKSPRSKLSQCFARRAKEGGGSLLAAQ